MVGPIDSSYSSLPGPTVDASSSISDQSSQGQFHAIGTIFFLAQDSEGNVIINYTDEKTGENHGLTLNGSQIQVNPDGANLSLGERVNILEKPDGTFLFTVLDPK